MPTVRPPTLTTTVRIARSPQTVAEHLVLGLVTGGLLGSGLVIERREADRFQFVKEGGLLTAGPDRGEIVLSETASGETEIECRLWCGGMGRLRLLRAALVGVLVATATALGFGWLLPLSLSVGVISSVGWDVVIRARQLAVLRRQFQAFVRNTNYLKTV
jgi:hypothetical protein